MVAIDRAEAQNQPPMTAHSPIDDLLDHLVRTTALSRDQATRFVAEVLTYFDEPLETFVRRRHRELQAEGLANAAIYQRIRNDLKFWRIAAPETSERQIRRIVYG
jgi:polyhydroxyalkanoate synthesis regulator phasin